MNIGGVYFSQRNYEQNHAQLGRQQEARRQQSSEDALAFMLNVVQSLQRHIDEMQDTVSRTQDTAQRNRLQASIRVNQAEIDRYQRKIKLSSKA